MTDTYNQKRYRQVISCLTQNIKQKLLMLEPQLASSVQEIRLRTNRPLCVTLAGISYYITNNCGIVNAPIKNSMLIVTKSDITDTFHNICNYSVYSRQNEIVNGYITLQGGHRAGICGTAVSNDEKIINIRDISSINLRISREHKGCSQQLVKQLKEKSGGVLICGAPCSGKTTVLRDIARIMSTELGKSVSLIDERGELAGTALGVYQNDIGFCDVYDSYIKSVAMLHSIRSMAPEIIICDEIGSDDDITAVEKSVNCGVRIIASVHCSDKSELKQKKNIIRLIKTGAFSTMVFLSDKNTPGRILKITEAGDFFDN